MADEALTVEAEETALDSSPEETTDDFSSDEDTSADAPLKADKGTRDKANERIRDLIEQRNALAAQLSAVQGQVKPAAVTPQYDGVTPDGIDPEKFAQSLTAQLGAQTRALTSEQVAFQIELMDVRKDPVMKSRVAQEHVSSLINQGIKPSEALEIYKDDLKTLEAEALEKAKTRKEATAATREGTTLSSAGKSSVPSGTFTWAQIETMPIAEYAKNQAEIKRQAAAGLIK